MNLSALGSFVVQVWIWAALLHFVLGSGGSGAWYAVPMVLTAIVTTVGLTLGLITAGLGAKDRKQAYDEELRRTMAVLKGK